LITSAEALPDGSVLSADLAVVGAGPAGIAIAIEVANKGFDVVLVESGYEEFDSNTQQLAEAADWNTALHAPMSMSVRRQLGGTSTIWGGRCVPFDRVDFERRDHISNIPWPVTYDELLPYYQRACSWLQCGRTAFDTTKMAHLPPSVVPGLPEGAGSSATFERWSLSTNFAREYGDVLKRSKRVRVVTGLTCIEVTTGLGDTRVKSLDCRTLKGKRVSIRARSYVLSCGGLETTRLLLASRGPHGEALGDRSGHLGAWYMGHVSGVIAMVRFSTPPRSTVFGYERDVDGTYVRRRFSIASAAQSTHALPNTIAYLANPDLADHRHRNGILSLAYLTLRSPLSELITPTAHRFSATGSGDPGGMADSVARASIRAHLMNVARDCPSVARFAVRFGARRFAAGRGKIPGFFSAYSGENCYPLQYSGEQIPNRQSRVSLASDRDSVGMPRLNIDLRFSQADADGILRCHEVWDNYLQSNDCGRIEYVSPDPLSVAWGMMGGGTHQLGTTRMASKADDGVVNKHLAVHGVPNLFVASSSVFLTSSQANPTFMVIVFALRLADHLTKEFISRPTPIVLLMGFLCWIMAPEAGSKALEEMPLGLAASSRP
jgi:choline dehydrogenase-like flavoprotein